MAEADQLDSKISKVDELAKGLEAERLSAGGAGAGKAFANLEFVLSCYFKNQDRFIEVQWKDDGPYAPQRELNRFERAAREAYTVEMARLQQKEVHPQSYWSRVQELMKLRSLRDGTAQAKVRQIKGQVARVLREAQWNERRQS
jgi:hypothetical protein